MGLHLTGSTVTQLNSAIDGRSVTRGGRSVKADAATGDGSTNDTTAFSACIATASAAGIPVVVPDGTYVLENVTVAGTATLLLSPGATLLHKAGATNPMFNFTGTSLRVFGGTLDGNQQNQTTRTLDLIAGQLQSGKRVVLKDLDVKNTVQTCTDFTLFAGYLLYDNVTVNGQSEHDGTTGHQTFISRIQSGQANAKGLVQVRGVRAYGTITPALPGGSPGGFFMAVNGYTAGSPGTDGFADGNLSTFQADDCYFYGYGQNCAGNDISPFHFYPAVAGVEINNFHAEGSGFCAISAKSCQDFNLSNAYVHDGQVSAQNTSTEGAVSVVPGYQAGTFSRPRINVSNVIVVNPGGEAADNLQACLNIGGTATSLADKVNVTNFVASGGGIGLRINQAKDVNLSNVMVNGGTTSSTGADHGIQATNITGDLRISGRVSVTNGHGINANTGNTTARLHLDNLLIKQTNASYYGVNARGVALLKVGSGASFDCVGTVASISADGSGNKVGWLAWDASATVINGTLSPTWANILKATGSLVGTGTPLGNVTPGEVGTTYRQSNGSADSVLWAAIGTTSADWIKVLSVALSSAGPPGVSGMLGWNFDPAFAITAQTAQAAGVLDVTRVRLLGGGIVANVVVQVTTAGTSLTTGQCLLGVYDTGGNLIGQSGDLSTTLASTGVKTIPLTVATSALVSGADVDVALLWNGTGTAPGLRGVNGSGQPNAGITATAANRRASAGSALTALPSTMPTKTAITTNPWVAVK